MNFQFHDEAVNAIQLQVTYLFSMNYFIQFKLKLKNLTIIFCNLLKVEQAICTVITKFNY